MNGALYNRIYELCRKSDSVSQEEMKNVTELTKKAEIYSDWPSNDEGTDFCLHTGLSGDGKTLRYFLRHFCRDWSGGWTYEDTLLWYEINESDYEELLRMKDKLH